MLILLALLAAIVSGFVAATLLFRLAEALTTGQLMARITGGVVLASVAGMLAALALFEALRMLP